MQLSWKSIHVSTENCNIQIFHPRFIFVKFLKFKVFIERRTRKKAILYIKVEIFYLYDTYKVYDYLEHNITLWKNKTSISLTQVILTVYGHRQFPSQCTSDKFFIFKDLLVPYLFHIHEVNKVGSCYNSNRYWSATGRILSQFLLPKASRAVSRMLTGLNGKSISFCTDKQGPICYQLSMCVVDPQMTYFVSQTEINQANRLKVDHSQRGKRAIARR